ncbi:rCG49984, isoform CRA_c [Rattus norvegicus]|uniref:RCG49984, isoform CRA_c n=1 Tax=Rattus norvegicus TaxID=10116 RepID=A6JV63_RAT|nr:rCG49984, isoform CRA_c [Rattus norvegicus]
MFWSIKEEMDWNKLWRYYSLLPVMIFVIPLIYPELWI